MLRVAVVGFGAATLPGFQSAPPHRLPQADAQGSMSNVEFLETLIPTATGATIAEGGQPTIAPRMP